MQIDVKLYEMPGACVILNDRMLVGTALDDETGEVLVGHWPDGEQWVELFRVPGDWTHDEGDE